MWRRLKSISFTLSLFLFLLWSSVFPCLCSANKILTPQKEQELMILLERAKTLQSQLDNNSIKSKEDLEKQNKQLTELQNECSKLKTQIATSQTETQKAKELVKNLEEQLTKLKTSFELYQKKMESQLRITKIQRNTWEVIAISSIIIALRR